MGEIRRPTGLNQIGVKDSANMWRTFNGEHFNHWMVGPTKEQINAYRAAGIRCRHVRNEVRQLNDLFVHTTTKSLRRRLTTPPQTPSPRRGRAMKVDERVIRALNLAIEDRQASDTVEMNVGDLAVMLGLLLASLPGAGAGEPVDGRCMWDQDKPCTCGGKLLPISLDASG